MRANSDSPESLDVAQGGSVIAPPLEQGGGHGQQLGPRWLASHGYLAFNELLVHRLPAALEHGGGVQGSVVAEQRRPGHRLFDLSFESYKKGLEFKANSTEIA